MTIKKKKVGPKKKKKMGRPKKIIDQENWYVTEDNLKAYFDEVEQ